MPQPLDWISTELDDLHQRGLFRKRRVVTSLPDGWCVVDGKRLRNFAANDYLNLTHDPRLISAAAEALHAGGCGASASPLITGRTEWHAALEERLARFEGQPRAILFPTGFAANLGTIAALAGEGDAVFCDRLNHASLVDGCRLSRARLRVYRHDALESLEHDLKKHLSVGRRLIVTDSVFSMDGDLAPLGPLCNLAEKFDAALIVDEAHATGVFGKQGRGVAELMDVEDRIAVRIGTLSKAVGALGGFVAGSKLLIDWLWNRARPQMFSTALPPAMCAAACAALDLIEAEPWRREQLQRLAAYFRERLMRKGIAIPEGVAGPIIPILLTTPEHATQVAARLEASGFLVAAIRPPTVPEGTSRLRITLNCGQTTENVDQLLEALIAALS